MAVLNSDGYAEDKFGAELAGGCGWNWSDEGAVYQAARSNIDRLEQTWERAAGANRFFQVAVGEDDRLAIIKVGCNDRERDAQVLEILSVENAIDQIAEAMIAGQAKARNAPSANVAEFESAAGGDNPRQGSAASVGRAENAANARASDAGNRYAILLENLKNAEMRESAGKAAAESDPNTWPSGQWGCTVCFALWFTYHGGIVAIVGCGER